MVRTDSSIVFMLVPKGVCPPKLVTVKRNGKTLKVLGPSTTTDVRLEVLTDDVGPGDVKISSFIVETRSWEVLGPVTSRVINTRSDVTFIPSTETFRQGV